jgi:glucose/arabinose dehydrogenase
MLTNVSVVLRTMPTYGGTMHFKSRLAFGLDGKLYVTLGERVERATRPQAQDNNSHLGKILRINPDGSCGG